MCHLEFIRILLSLLFLSVSSWYDYKFREVSDRIWLLFAPTSLILTFTQYYLEFTIKADYSIFFFWLLSLGVTIPLSLLLFHLGFFGGADAKALICLSLAMPAYPRISNAQFNSMLPIFPLAVLVNAVFAASMLTLIITCHNIIEYLHVRGEMFRGFEHEPCWKKMLVFITGVRINPKRLKDSHYIPLEYAVKGKSGEVTRYLRVSPQIEEECPIYIEALNGQIWATPGLPFLIFMTVGFVIALLLGDFVDWMLILLFPQPR